jgi:hypothetical protein
MRAHNPLSPGEIINELCFEPLGLDARVRFAQKSYAYGQSMNKTIFMMLLLLYSIRVCSESDKIEEVEFISHGDKLSGSIAFPVDKEIHSAVVFVHGSGKQTRNIVWAENFAKEGIAALVYDKRGVGKSGGKYESEGKIYLA